MRQLRCATNVAAVALAVGLLGTACLIEGGDASPDPLRPGPSTPRVAPPDDAVLEGWIFLDDGGVTMMLVNVLRGEEALEAARADGIPVEDDVLPDGVYVRERGEATTIPLGADAQATIRECPSSLGEMLARLLRGSRGDRNCVNRVVPVDDLAAGRVQPDGGESALFSVRIVGGRAVELTELTSP